MSFAIVLSADDSRPAELWEMSSEGSAYGQIREMRATMMRRHFRILFAWRASGSFLPLTHINKDTPKMPLPILRRAERRLRGWRGAGV